MRIRLTQNGKETRRDRERERESRQEREKEMNMVGSGNERASISVDEMRDRNEIRRNKRNNGI